MSVREMSLDAAIHMSRSQKEESNVIDSIFLDGNIGLLPLIEYNTRRQIALHILKALKYLHSNGIIHNNIKPDNILLTDLYSAKIADFGSCFTYTVSDIEKQPSRNAPCTYMYRPIKHIKESSSHYFSYEVDIWAAGCVY
jgi:serine/threonine protein kinase